MDGELGFILHFDTQTTSKLSIARYFGTNILRVNESKLISEFKL